MKNNWMSKAMSVASPLLIVCIVLTLGAAAAAQSGGGVFESKRCSNQTLSGDYGMHAQGTLLGPNWPLQTLAKVSFDGKGNMTSLVYKVINGTPTYVDWTSEGSRNLCGQSGLHRISSVQWSNPDTFCGGK